jgi:competence protein ComFB
MPLDVYHYMSDLRNMNEKRVWSMLSEYIDNNDMSGVCLCPICIVDIAAITLNSIPAHYQTEENLSVAVEKVSDVEIYKQIKKAVAVVSRRPHH